MSEAFLLEKAWVDGAIEDDVLVEIEHGRFSRVEPGASSGTRIAGLTLPGLANCHSHAFHRALRGNVAGPGTFWTWRAQMYDVAAALDPDQYHRLALETYREMLAAGYTSVGEFHYLHHQPDGTPYDDPNAMGEALIAAARDAGIRIALLDTCYLAAGFGREPEGVQRRFSDGDAERWAERVADLRSRWSSSPSRGTSDGRVETRGVVIGAAVHSVRAVPAEQLATIARASEGRPLHAHVSEQPAENDDCEAAYAATPTQLLADHGVLGRGTTAVHATHVTGDDVHHLADTGTTVCVCPTTEEDLADGLGAAGALRDADVPLTLGSDSHAVIDPFAEMRGLEMHERLRTGRRGVFATAELVAVATGHASLGFGDAGEIAVGSRADLVTLDLATARTSGASDPIPVATAADVTRVVVDGRVVS